MSTEIQWYNQYFKDFEDIDRAFTFKCRGRIECIKEWIDLGEPKRREIRAFDEYGRPYDHFNDGEFYKRKRAIKVTTGIGQNSRVVFKKWLLQTNRTPVIHGREDKDIIIGQTFEFICFDVSEDNFNTGKHYPGFFIMAMKEVHDPILSRNYFRS